MVDFKYLVVLEQKYFAEYSAHVFLMEVHILPASETFDP